MDITKFTQKPQLVEVIIDDPEMIEKYGDSIKFHTYDTVKLTTYFAFFESRVNGEYDRLEKIMRNLILDKDGKEIVKEDETLPADIFTQAILKIGEILGKLPSKTST